MAAPKHLTFQFLPEDRAAIAAALEAHPSVAREDAGPRQARYRVEAGAARCAVELAVGYGAVVFAPDAGDAAAALAEAVLTEHGAVFTACC